MTRRSRFTQADIVRAIRGFQNAGMTVGAVRIDPDGTIAVIARGYEDSRDIPDWREGTIFDRSNEWDDLK